MPAGPPENQGGTIDDLIGDLSAPPEEQPGEEGPSLPEKAKDLKEQVERGKKTYEKLKGKPEAAPKAGATKGLGEGAKATGEGVKTAAKAGKTAAQAGATAAKAGTAAAEAGTAAAAGAATGGIGAVVVLAADLGVRVGKWALKHRRTLLWILAFLVFCSILIFLIFGGLAAHTLSGGLGKSYPQPGGPDSPNIKKILELADQPSQVSGYNKIVFKEEKDKEYVQSGKLDDRLAMALAYLASKHEMIQISHIISEYEYMNIAEAGKDTNPQVIQNISAHKDGLAADIDEIDFVYKVFEPRPECGSGRGDIVFYNDLNEELLRLKCQGTLASINQNTTWNGKPAEGIPIKILYQDPKPNIEHAGNEPDPSLTTDPIEKQIYENVYQPEARRKIHLAISELLEFPYETEDVNLYRITQLITFSEERDVIPFQDDGTLDELYGMPRPANFGLFYMLEAWQNIHIGY